MIFSGRKVLPVVAVMLLISHLVLLVFQSCTFVSLLPISGAGLVWLHVVLLVLVSLGSFFVGKVGQPLQSGRGEAASLVFLIVGFAFLVVLSTCFNHLGSQNIARCILAVVTIFSLLYACPRLLTRGNYRAIFASVVLLFAFHSLVSLIVTVFGLEQLGGYQLGSQVGRPIDLFGRRGALFTGAFTNPNALGCYLLLLPALALEVAASQKKVWWRRGFRAIALCLFGHLCFLLSRANILSLTIASGVWGIFKFRSGRGRLLAWLVLAASAIYLSCLALNLSGDLPGSLRLQIWHDYFLAIFRQPWGYGFEGLQLRGESPHNFFLAWATYSGIAGAIVLAAIIGLQLKVALSRNHTCVQRLLLSTVFAVVILHGSVEFVIGHPLVFMNSLFWLVLGYLCLPCEENMPG